MKKSVKILIGVLGSIVGIFGILVSTAAIYSVTYKVPEQEEHIENNTGLVVAKNRSLYDLNGNRLILEGVNFGNIFLQEGWLSPFAIEPLKIAMDHIKKIRTEISFIQNLLKKIFIKV